MALVIVAVFVAAVVFTISSGDGTQQAPTLQPGEAPAVPGEWNPLEVSQVGIDPGH